MKQYEYLIAFSAQGGNGTAYVTRNDKLDSIQKCAELQKYIEAENNLTNVAIMNFQLIREKTTGEDFETE